MKIPDSSEQMYGRSVGDMIEDGAKVLDDGTVIATFPHVDGYTQFSSDPAEQSGNYFPFKLTKSGSKMTFWKNGVKSRDNINWEENNVFRITAPTDTFRVDVDGEEAVTFNFRYSTLKPE